MTADDVSALVRRALAELVTPPPRRALVLFTGALIGFERVIGELDLLVARASSSSTSRPPAPSGSSTSDSSPRSP